MQKTSVTVGLISDTHMPFRWNDIPETVYQAFAGVDLIIHAGDVGEMWVLDKLSGIAPVVAVHGNDEGEAAQRALPFQHTLVLAGQRVVVTHGHLPDHEAEMTQRKDDAWRPKLARLADAAVQHGASITLYGHTHIPMALQYNGVWLINAGAIASGGLTIRQALQSVARLHLENGAEPVIEHLNLNQDGQPFTPQIDLDAGFLAAWGQFSETILDSELEAHIAWVRDEVYPLAPEAVADLWLLLAHKRWYESAPPLGVDEFITAVKNDGLPPVALDKLREHEFFRSYL